MVRKTADEEGAETEEPALIGLRDRARTQWNIRQWVRQIPR